MRLPFDIVNPALPPELLAQRGPRGAISINPRNPAYPIVVAVALDALEAAGGSYAVGARTLGLTTSQLLRFLRSDPEIWRTLKTRSGEAPTTSDP